MWESYKLDPYVQRLAEAVFTFQEKVDDLLAVEEQMETELKALDTCHYGHNTFQDVLTKVQKAVDDLSLHQYSNLPQWVAKLDQQVTTSAALISGITIPLLLHTIACALLHRRVCVTDAAV